MAEEIRPYTKEELDELAAFFAERQYAVEPSLTWEWLDRLLATARVGLADTELLRQVLRDLLDVDGTNDPAFARIQRALGRVSTQRSGSAAKDGEANG